MSDLEKLKQMNVKEIQKKTRLTEKRIDEIINKKFDKLDKVKAHGFINILEQEYNFDLSEWRNEYKQYWKDKEDSENNIASSSQTPLNNIDKEKKEKKIASINVETIKMDKNNKLKIFIYTVSGFFVLIIILIIYFISSNNAKNTDSIEINKPLQQEEVIVPLQNEENTNNFNESNLQKEQTNLPSKPELTQDTSNLPNKNNAISMHKIIITPNSDLWIGFVNLKTKKATERIIPAHIGYTLDIENKIAFKFGHTDLAIDIDGDVQTYSNPKPSRFIYDPAEGLKKLTIREFNGLVGENAW